MKPLAALFDKNGVKLCLFVKAKSQAKKLINPVVCYFHQRKDDY